MKKFTLLFVVALAAAYSAVAQNFTATYTFDSVKTTSGLTDPTPVPTVTGMTFGSFSAVGVTGNSSASGRFSLTGWPTGGAANNNTYSAHTGAISTTQYYEVTLTPSMSQMASLTGVMFRVQRSGTGIRTYAVRSSADSYAANLTASVMTNSNLSTQAGNVFYYNYDSLSSGQSGSMITLTGANYTNFTSPLTFRFYGWNAEGSGGTFSIDTVVFMGSVSGATSINNFTALATTAVVYPNPSQDGFFAVNTGNVSGATTVTVYNIIGKVVYTSEFNGNNGTIDLSTQPNGSYFAAIKNNAGTITRKIIINK